MANNSILIVDDTPVNLKLVRVLLSRQGFDVRTANTAEEALEVAQSFHPNLVLADIQLPGMDGLEMTRRLKSDPATRQTIVLALTAFAMKGDEQKAFAAGCDGYITKPIDTRTFPALIRKYLSRDAGTANGVTPTPTAADDRNGVPLRDLQQTFLSEAIGHSGRLIGTLGSGLDQAQALVMAHRWAGTAGSIGYPEISRHARELETQLAQNGAASQAKTREALVHLARLFAEGLEELSGGGTKTTPSLPAAPLPDLSSPDLMKALAGKRFALVGFASEEAAKLSQGLSRLQAFSRELGGGAAIPDSETLRPYDLVLLSVPPAMSSIPQWNKPVVLVGPRDILLRLAQPAQANSEDFLFTPWTVEDAILRSYFVMSRAAQTPVAQRPAAGREKRRIVVADDDSTIRALVEASLQNSGLECRSAGDGDEALEMIRKWQPDAAVLDVNMPSLNGFQVLSSLRNDPLTKGVRVILLTALQRETDVIRGFGLGADDYVIKPFSPMELIARLKRLLGNQP